MLFQKLNDTPPSLRPVQTDEFLPPVSRWTIIGGVVLMGGILGAIALSAMIRYTVTVRAPATVRPSGGLRVVQAGLDGRIVTIEVDEHQTVQQGDVIARLDPLPLETQQAQLQASITQAETQLQQTELQLRLFDAQLAAESQSIAQALSVAQSELSRTQQELSNQRAIAQANLAEAEAVLEFARNEMQQYAQLLDEGAVSQLQVKEKEATVRTAEAQLTRAQVTLDPFTASVAIAQARIDQQQAQGKATLATLNREREALRQQQVKLQSQVVRDRHALQQIEAELQKTDIRATSDGTLFRLNLRNPSQIVQASDVIAEIAPDANALAIKAAVRPQDIDRVQIGLPVKLRITACPYPDFGLLPGTVTAVSPDVIVPDASSTLGITNAGLRESNTYYDITIEPDRLVLERGERQCRLLPGMDVEANIISKEENVLLYLLRKARLLTNI